MLGFSRWAGPTILLAGVLAAFMAFDKTTLHWYVPESDGSAVRDGDSTPAPGAIVAVASTATPTVAARFTAFEAQALALQWVSGSFFSLGGWDCDLPELNDLQSRWTTVCTERTVEDELVGQSEVMAVAVDAITGDVTDLQRAATAATKTPTNTATATATATKTPR